MIKYINKCACKHFAYHFDFINNEHEHIIYELINKKETCISLATDYVLRMSNALQMMN